MKKISTLGAACLMSFALHHDAHAQATLNGLAVTNSTISGPGSFNVPSNNGNNKYPLWSSQKPMSACVTIYASASANLVMVIAGENANKSAALNANETHGLCFDLATELYLVGTGSGYWRVDR